MLENIINAEIIEETQNRERPVPFYNWLKERDSRAEICNGPNLENWIEW